ncbi:MAG: O-antigen ligase family protein [Candidatus Omnitrophota bacterium]
MSYLIIFMLALRVFICEKAWPTAGIFFDICFTVCFALYIIIDRKIIINRKTFFYPLGLSGLLLLNTLFSLNTYNSQNETLKFLMYLLIFIFVYWQSQEKRKILLNLMLFAAALISIRAVYQFFTGMDYINQHYSYAQIVNQGFYAWEMLKQKRVISWFFAPNLLAAYLITIAPVLGGYMIKSYRQKQVKQSMVLSIIFLVLCAGLYLTRSFGAYLAFGVSLFFMSGNLLNDKENNKKNWIIAGVLLLLIFGAMFSQRAKYFLEINNPQNSLIQRLYYWKSSAAVIKANPLKGIGLGNFGIVYPRFKQPDANETIYSHNMFLQLWAETGTIMFFGFLCVLVYMFARGFKRSSDPVEIGLRAGVLAFLAHNFFDYSFFITQSGYVWIIITACLFKPKPDLSPRKNNGGVAAVFFTKSVYILLSGLMIFYLNLEYKSQTLLDEAYLSMENKEVNSAIAQANKALNFRKNNDAIYYFLALCAERKSPGKFSQAAVDYYNKAINLNKNYAFYYYYLSKYYFSFQMKAEGAAYKLKALSFYPGNKKFAAE